MITLELLEPILQEGIRSTNFFNGRLLTAEDLKVEQAVNRQQHQQLGKAIGEGVVQGLEVSIVSSGSNGAIPTISINEGLALNRKGQALTLPLNVNLALVREIETIAAGSGLFATCEPPKSTAILTGTGVYILLIAPASDYEGRVPMSGLEAEGKITGCGSRYVVEGVQFRLVELNVDNVSSVSDTTRNLINQLMASSDTASLSKLQNLLAHLCFGTEELMSFPRDPLKLSEGRSSYVDYGALDALRSLECLKDCDVPLALIYWTTKGIQFVDMWSVRRRSIPKSSSVIWPLTVSERRLAEGEAVFLQFQDHVAKIAGLSTFQSQLEKIEANKYFRYLPAAGIIPFTTGGLSRGFNYLTFFKGLTYRNPVFIEGVKLQPLVRSSFSYTPIDLGSKELIWLYLVRENMQEIDKKTTKPLKSYLIFARGHIPYQGDARYNLALWDYSNYSLVKS